jgi:ABC-type transport system substrate-binding protein
LKFFWHLALCQKYFTPRIGFCGAFLRSLTTCVNVNECRSKWLLLLVAMFIGFVSNACYKAGERTPDDVFVYNESNGISSLDPALASYQSAQWAGSQLFNGLVELDSSLEIIPCIAKSWSVDSSGCIWKFVLRNDVYFHEDNCFGNTQKTRLVNAYDVRYSFERILSARTKSTGLWVFNKRLLGAEEFHRLTKSSSTNTSDIDGLHCKGIIVVDDTIIQFQLQKPFAPFLSLLTMPYCWILPHEAVEFYGEDFGRHPVGTGAFTFGSWSTDIELKLNANRRYFKKDANGQSLPYLQGIRITFLRDTKTEFLEFRRGKYDILTQIDPSFMAAVMNFNGTLRGEYSKFCLQQVSAHAIEYYGILLDTMYESARSVPLARNRLVRQALNYAIDREKITRFVLRGKGIPANHGVLPPSMPGFSDELKGYSYNPEKARQLLAIAGYGINGNVFPKCTLQMGTNQRTASVGEAVQQMWKDIGVDVTIRQVDFPQHLEMVRSGKLHLWRTSWIGDYPDPENFLSLFYSGFRSPSGPNTTHFSSRKIDSLYESSLSPRLSPAERYMRYRNMDSLIVQEAPWVFLYYNVIQRLVQPDIKSLPIDGTDRLVLERVQKVRQQ